MIQIIEESFDSIEKARDFSNKIAIEYKNVKDVEIIFEEKGKYTVVIKLYIDCKYQAYATFDLAKLSLRDSDEMKYIWEFDHIIKFVDKRLKEAELFNYIDSTICEYGEKGYIYELRASFNIKDWIEMITIKYNGYGEYEITLNKFGFSSYCGYFGKTEEHFFTDNIDSDILYNHIIETYKQRGYLFDFNSLEKFRDISNGISRGINEGLIEKKLRIKEKNY